MSEATEFETDREYGCKNRARRNFGVLAITETDERAAQSCFVHEPTTIIVPMKYGGAKLQSLHFRCNANEGARDATDFMEVRAANVAQNISQAPRQAEEFTTVTDAA